MSILSSESYKMENLHTLYSVRWSIVDPLFSSLRLFETEPISGHQPGRRSHPKEESQRQVDNRLRHRRMYIIFTVLYWLDVDTAFRTSMM